eukprot:scaffold2872_cov112-Isochrysis_galbana.AAC.21
MPKGCKGSGGSHPIAAAAAISPMAGPILKACPDPPPASTTRLRSPGTRPMMKSWSGVDVYMHDWVSNGVFSKWGKLAPTRREVESTTARIRSAASASALLPASVAPQTAGGPPAHAGRASGATRGPQ